MARMTEGLATLAIAADLATGRPKWSGLSAAVAAVELARHLRLSVTEQKDAFYLAAVRFIGCTITSHETGMMALGDDQGFAVATMLGDWADPDDLHASLDRYIAPEAPEGVRRQAFTAICEALPTAAPDFTAAHCRQSFLLAQRLPVSKAVLEAIPYYYARFDGKVLPFDPAKIPALSKLVRVTEIAELARRLENADAAIELIASKAGHELDPSITRIFLAEADSIFEAASRTPEFEAFIEAEPGEPIEMTPQCRETLAEVAADMSDHKAAFFQGHSRRVASLAARAGQALNLTDEEISSLRLAGLVHDIGKCAISNRIWYKDSPLTASERLEMQSHPFQTEFILSHGEPFSDWARMAACAHERADGSGYHRQVPLSDLTCNILAAANLYDELTHRTAERPAFSGKDAADFMTRAAQSGKLLPLAVTGVLKAVGHGGKTSRQALPFDLTRREAQVLARLTKSETTAQIARALEISPKTTDHHIQNIYRKTNTRGRTAVALLALEHGIIAD